MPMSRRHFFRAVTGKEEPRHQLNRATALDAYVRTHLLPYDFSLTDEQVEHLLGVVRCGLAGGEGTEFSSEERQRIAAIAQETIRVWREDYWNAEQKRRDAIILVREFIHAKAAPDALERRAVSWLYKLLDARLAPLNPGELKELVFSQMNAWYPPDK